MMRRFVPTCVFFSFVAGSPSQASPVTTVDILGPGDGVLHLPAPNILCVDVLVDVPAAGAWYVGSVRAIAQNGATLRYAIDSSTGEPVLTSPGTADRFVTFFSRPRGRDADDRFTTGAAREAGRASPPGPVPTATAGEINVAFFASPPPTLGSPSVDGAVFRISVDLPAGHTSDEYSVVSFAGPLTPPPNAILYSTGGQLGDLGTTNASTDTLTESLLDWYVTPIPEPGTLTLFLLGILVPRRRS